MGRTYWTLGAVMTPDGPVADVRVGWVEPGPDYRVMGYASWDEGERRRFDRCGRRACRVGEPCEKHNQIAAWWWFEWARREEKERQRDAFAFEVERDGVRYCFRPHLPGDRQEFWGSLTRWRGERWQGWRALTADQAAEEYAAAAGVSLDAARDRVLARVRAEEG